MKNMTFLGVVAVSALSLALAAAEQITPFANGDFEQYEGNRPVKWTLGRQMKAGRGLGHNANGGLVWESVTPLAERLCSARQMFGGFMPGDFFHFSALVKKENYKAGSGDGLAIVIEWWDADKHWICAPAARGTEKTPGDWYQVEGGGIVPAKAAYGILHIYVCKGSSGRVSVDNVTVRQLVRDPVQFVCSSAYRDTAVSGPVSFHAVVSVAPTVKKAGAFFRWKGVNGETCRRPADHFSLATTEGEASLTLQVADLAHGSSPVVCELWADGQQLGESSVSFTRADELPKRRVWIDAHKRCIVDGKPFFPLGMYWGQTLDRTLDIYTNGAFNCVMPYQKMTLPILDKLQSAGIMTFSCVNDLTIGKPELLRRIEEQRNHPALLGWYVMDEAGVEKVGQLVDWYQFIRQHDADHPAYAVQDRIYDLRNFMPATDVFGLDPYPVADRSLNRVTEFTRGGEKAVFGTRAFWNVPQTFAWKWYRPGMGDKGRFPTFEEIRSMSWQHIAGGANGLISFCFYRIIEEAKEPDPVVRKENFSRVCRVSHEIARMFPVLLSIEDCPKISYPADSLACRAWVKDGELYLLACNLTDKPLEADVSVEGGPWHMVACEVGEPATRANDGRVHLSLPSIGVSFVRLRNR